VRRATLLRRRRLGGGGSLARWLWDLTAEVETQGSLIAILVKRTKFGGILGLAAAFAALLGADATKVTAVAVMLAFGLLFAIMEGLYRWSTRYAVEVVKSARGRGASRPGPGWDAAVVGAVGHLHRRSSDRATARSSSIRTPARRPIMCRRAAREPLPMEAPEHRRHAAPASPPPARPIFGEQSGRREALSVQSQRQSPAPARGRCRPRRARQLASPAITRGRTARVDRDALLHFGTLLASANRSRQTDRARASTAARP